MNDQEPTHDKLTIFGRDFGPEEYDYDDGFIRHIRIGVLRFTVHYHNKTHRNSPWSGWTGKIESGGIELASHYQRDEQTGFTKDPQVVIVYLEAEGHRIAREMVGMALPEPYSGASLGEVFTPIAQELGRL